MSICNGIMTIAANFLWSPRESGPATEIDSRFTASGCALEYRLAPHRMRETVTSPLDAAFERGLQFHQQGRFGEAETAYREILAIEPRHADSLHMLGLLAHEAGQVDAGIELLEQALAVQPNNAVYLSNLGELLRSKGRLAEAVKVLRRAVRLDLQSHNAAHNLGLALREAGRVDEATLFSQQAVNLAPHWPEPRKVLVNLLIDARRFEEALPHAVQLANQLRIDAEAFRILGRILVELSLFEDAEQAFLRSVASAPTSAVNLNELGTVQLRLLKTREAGESFRRAIEADPKFDWPYNNYAGVLKDTGRVDEAFQYFHRGLELNPALHSARSNMLLSMHYSTSLDQARIADEHRQWEVAYRISHPSSAPTPFVDHDRTPDRVLRVGYISADLRAHSVADFLEALWKQHASPRATAARASNDAQQIEVYAYADVRVPDVVTESLKGYVDVWRDIVRLSEADIAAMIRRDQIDILIDLAGHSAHNHMPVFAMKPAPIQLSWLGYPDTTGLSTVDYRFTDAWADPPGTTEQYFTEELYRLPNGFLCYHPTVDCPEVGPLPCDTAPGITLGCFNNFAKLNLPLIQLWKRLLDELPEATLLLKATVLGEGYAREVMSSYFSRAGLDESRVRLLGAERDFYRHMTRYHQVDIGLDTFPYHGTTTTCEALWMGIPVVTLAGRVHASRVGVSVLTNAGVPEFIAETPDEYIQKVVDLARNRDRLREIRSTLRSMLTGSPLLDAPRFAKDFETALRHIWTSFCGKSRT